jgi:2,3-bisphosphoglycerate-independent phosphoglycerate mutase
LLWKNSVPNLCGKEQNIDVGTLTPPHDILDMKIGKFLNDNKNSRHLFTLMEKSYSLLKNHPINTERVKKGKKPANAIWLWGEGVKCSLPSFKEKYGLSGAVISAVDLLRGIGKYAGMKIIYVDGATGYLDSNFTGKAAAAIEALKSDTDFVYLHIEAPDECGHRNEIDGKVRAIELIDELVLKPILDAFSLEKKQEIKILICPDHATPLSLRTHTNDAVPFLVYNSSKPQKGEDSFTEENARRSGLYIERGYELMDFFLS